MKKSMLSIIGLVAAMTLTGCGGGGEAPSSTSNVVLPVESIRLNAGKKALLVGDSLQVKPLVTPLLASSAALVYESSDKEVATVDSNGLVMAKKQGSTTIKVSSKDNPKVYTEMKIFVAANQNADAVQNKLANLLVYQKTKVKKPRKLATTEVETRTLYVDGKVYKKSFEIADFILDKDEAYFHIGGIDADSKYYDAPEHRSTFGYHFYTDVDYHSFLYHENDNVHNWCYVPTEFYLGTGTTRDGVIYAMMGSFFNRGSDIAENTVEYSMSSDFLGPMYRKMCYAGGFDDDMVFGKFQASSKDQKADISEENNLDIPAGTLYDEIDNFEVYWYKGNAKYYRVNFKLSYVIDGHNYVLDILRDYSFDRDDEFSYQLPDRSKYIQVKDVFEL